MSKKADIEALVNLLNYSELEARRLGASAVVARHLRVATEELTRAASQQLVAADDVGTNRAH